jgi:hypothetical protein
MKQKITEQKEQNKKIHNWTGLNLWKSTVDIWTSLNYNRCINIAMR